MKITDLKVFHMAGGHANWIFVKLYTDVGLTGVGESSMERHDPLLIRALESFRDFLVGKDPHRIELIWNSLYKQTFWYGQLIQLAALSGVEQALWDIKGKALGVPVHELLGRAPAGPGSGLRQCLGFPGGGDRGPRPRIPPNRWPARPRPWWTGDLRP